MPGSQDRPSRSDRELMEVLSDPVATAAEKKEACRELFERHCEEMFRWAALELRGQEGTKIQEVDVVQEVFGKLLQTSAAGTFLPEFALRPWLYRVVQNMARDMLRRERRQPAAVEDRVLNSAAAAISPAPPSPDWEELEARMVCLSTDERRLFELRYIRHHPAVAIGKEYGKSAGWVYLQLRLIKEKLRNYP